MKTNTINSWVLRLIIAIIFIQTLYFKFTAHPDSVYIFSELGVEPYGRVGLGIIELITAVLLMVNSTKIIAIFLSIGIIIGAIGSHILVIGTSVQGDGGGLFALAWVVLLAGIVLLFIHKKELNIFRK